MNLKKATFLAVIAICYIFALRAIGTFFPSIFKNLPMVQVTTTMSFLASIILVLFYTSFYRRYVQKEQLQLKEASTLAIVGSSAVLLLQVKGLFLVFNEILVSIYRISPHLVGLIRSRHAIVSIVPWVSSVFILLFFVVFHREALRKEQKKLTKALLWAVVGSSIGTLLRTIVIFNYIFFREVRWFSDVAGKIQIIFFPIITFGFVAVLYFFLSFYKAQKMIT